MEASGKHTHTYIYMPKGLMKPGSNMSNERNFFQSLLLLHPVDLNSIHGI